MADYQIAPGASVTDVVVRQKFDQSAVLPSLQVTDSDPFKWHLATRWGGQFAATTVAAPAMAASFSFVPKNVPSGFQFGVKQLAFLMGETGIYQGNASSDGSIVAGSTGINFTWLLDVAAQMSADVFRPLAFPFYSTKPITVANGTQGKIEAMDSPSVFTKLVRSNLVTNARLFLTSHKSTMQFVTFLVVVKPNATHMALAGFSWTVQFDSQLSWSGGNPTLNATGNAGFLSKLDRDTISDVQRQLLDDNSAMPADTIDFKYNNAMMAAEIRDENASPRRQYAPVEDIVIAERSYSITHSARPAP